MIISTYSWGISVASAASVGGVVVVVWGTRFGNSEAVKPPGVGEKWKFGAVFEGDAPEGVLLPAPDEVAVDAVSGVLGDVSAGPLVPSWAALRDAAAFFTSSTMKRLANVRMVLRYACLSESSLR